MQRLQTVLFVSADPSFNRRVQDSFPHKIYKICQNFQEAECFIAEDDMPDLFVIDLVLPDITGPEALEKLQQPLLPKEVPGIIATSNDRLVLYSEIRPPALIGIISKTGDESFIYERVKKLWEDYQTWLFDGADSEETD